MNPIEKMELECNYSDYFIKNDLVICLEVFYKIYNTCPYIIQVEIYDDYVEDSVHLLTYGNNYYLNGNLINQYIYRLLRNIIDRYESIYVKVYDEGTVLIPYINQEVIDIL